MCNVCLGFAGGMGEYEAAEETQRGRTGTGGSGGGVAPEVGVDVLLLLLLRVHPLLRGGRPPVPLRELLGPHPHPRCMGVTPTPRMPEVPLFPND